MRTSNGKLIAIAAVGALFVLGGCQGAITNKPPVHLNPNMDEQAKFQTQESTDFFADGRIMRPSVAGTVAIGQLREDDHYFRGMVDGQPALEPPAQVTVNAELLARGQERFNIFCAVCHDQAGSGDGTAIRRGMVKPPNLHDGRVRAIPLGKFVDIMNNGVRNMPSYRSQIPIEDRWAIAIYLRTLQLSQGAPLEVVPEDVAVSKGWK